MISFKHLQNALLLAEHRNFHRAAEAGYVSQSALSRSIQALENQLGVVLFTREYGNVEPTLFGQLLLERAPVILNETGELQREIELLQGLESGSLNVAAGTYAAELSVNAAVGQLIESYSRLTCRLHTVSWRDAIALVTSGEVDLGIAEISDIDLGTELVVEPISSHRMGLFVRSGHPLCDLGRVYPADLADFPMVSVRLPPRGRGLFPGQTQLDPSTGDVLPSVEVDDFAGVLGVVKHSQAFSVATFLQLEMYVRSGELAVLPFAAEWLRLDYGFIRRRRRMLSPATLAFQELVKGIEESLRARNLALYQKFIGDTSD